MPFFRDIWAFLTSCSQPERDDLNAAVVDTKGPNELTKLHGYDMDTVMEQLANPTKIYGTTAPRSSYYAKKTESSENLEEKTISEESQKEEATPAEAAEVAEV